MKNLAKKIKYLLIVTFFLLPQIIFAQSDAVKKLQSVGEADGPYKGTNGDSIYGIVADLIGVFLGLLGVIFIILIILSGYWWMTASGDEQKLTKAKDTIYRAIIGLIITAAAYAITGFVFQHIGGGGSGSGLTSGGA
jgi:hypothetical protein